MQTKIAVSEVDEIQEDEEDLALSVSSQPCFSKDFLFVLAIILLYIILIFLI